MRRFECECCSLRVTVAPNTSERCAVALLNVSVPESLQMPLEHGSRLNQILLRHEWTCDIRRLLTQ